MNYIQLVAIFAYFAQLSSCQEVNYLRDSPYDHIYPYTDIASNQQNCSVANNRTCPLYIALMMSYGGDLDSSGVLPGVQVAIDQINNDPTILPGYTLHYILIKTKVNT